MKFRQDTDLLIFFISGGMDMLPVTTRIYGQKCWMMMPIPGLKKTEV